MRIHLRGYTKSGADRVRKVDNPHLAAFLGLGINAAFAGLIRFWPSRSVDRHRRPYINRVFVGCMLASLGISTTLIMFNADIFEALDTVVFSISSWAWIGLVALASHLVLLRMPTLFVLRVRDEAFAAVALEVAKLLDDYVDSDQSAVVSRCIEHFSCKNAAALRSYDLHGLVSSLQPELECCSDDAYSTAPVVAAAIRGCVVRLADDTRSVFKDFDQVFQIAGLGVFLTLLASLRS